MTQSLIFIDVEASGLHPGSYPTEVGWCSHDLRRGGSHLIRPTPEWSAGPWSAEAEAVTGISRPMLDAYGWEPAAVAAALNEALAGEMPLTDNPWGDGRWLLDLFAAAGADPAFGICPPYPINGSATEQQLWHDIKARYDIDILIAQVAGDSGATGWTEIEEATGRLKREAGLLEHRALDDAIGHALALGAAVILGARKDDAEAQNAALSSLAARARQLLDEIPRPGR